MSTETHRFSIAEVFATFPGPDRFPNALALAAGILPFAVVGVLAAPLGDPVAALLAGFATGAYFGGIYARAVGGPIWNLALPGLIASVVLAIPAIPPGSGTRSEWLAPLSAYLTVTLVVAFWHRRLGDSQGDWAAAHFPTAYRDLLGVTDA